MCVEENTVVNAGSTTAGSLKGSNPVRWLPLALLALYAALDCVLQYALAATDAPSLLHIPPGAIHFIRVCDSTPHWAPAPLIDPLTPPPHAQWTPSMAPSPHLISLLCFCFYLCPSHWSPEGPPHPAPPAWPPQPLYVSLTALPDP